MRMLMKVTIPVEMGNRAIKDGQLPKIITEFVERNKPESCWFLPQDGKRTAFFILDMKDTSQLPVLSEPFFSNMNASVEVVPVMNLDDLRQGLEQLNRR